LFIAPEIVMSEISTEEGRPLDLRLQKGLDLDSNNFCCASGQKLTEDNLRLQAQQETKDWDRL